MSMEFIVPVLSVVAGIGGIIAASRSWTTKSKAKKSIKLQIGDLEKFEISSDVTDEELDRLIEILRKKLVEGHSIPTPKRSKESGFITQEFFLLGVPGIIALLLFITFIYLIVQNQANTDYATPKELNTAMTTILGYYFGIGASTATSKGKILSTTEVREIIDQYSK